MQCKISFDSISYLAHLIRHAIVISCTEIQQKSIYKESKTRSIQSFNVICEKFGFYFFIHEYILFIYLLLFNLMKLISYVVKRIRLNYNKDLVFTSNRIDFDKIETMEENCRRK